MSRPAGHVPGTTPYPWPWNGRLGAAQTALLVVTPAAGLSLAGTGQADAVAAVAGCLSAAGGVVVQVVTAPPPAGGPPSGRLPTGLAADHVVRARGVDGFYGSGLDALLRTERVDLLLLAGAGLETSVHSTMRSANDRGYECLLVFDACLAHDHDLAASARSQIEMSGGIFGAVGTSAAVLAALTPLVSRKESR